MVTVNNVNNSGTVTTKPYFSPITKNPTTGGVGHAVNNPFDPNPVGGANIGTSATQNYQPALPVSPIEGYSSIKQSLGTPNQIDVPSVLGMFKDQQPTYVKGLGNDYFQSERDRRKEELRNEFFGATGVLNQRAYEESGSGRLGSGVGKRMIEATVTNPFMQSYTGIDRDVAQQQAQEIARVDEVNAKLGNDYRSFLGNLAQSDTGNYLQAQIANNEIQMQLDDLAARLGSDYAKQMNEYELQSYANYIDLLKAQIDQDNYEKQYWLDKQKLEFDINQ